jgi:hypothetical protein
VIAVAVLSTASAGLRRLALRTGRELWRGLAVLRRPGAGSRVVALVLVAVFAQILRNWLMLHAVGVDASLLDAVALLIAVSVLGQLPIGPMTGATAAILILGSNGVAATAAAGVLLTVTGTLGGLCFAGWAGADHLHSGGARRRQPTPSPGPASSGRDHRLVLERRQPAEPLGQVPVARTEQLHRGR